MAAEKDRVLTVADLSNAVKKFEALDFMADEDADKDAPATDISMMVNTMLPSFTQIWLCKGDVTRLC